MDRRDLIKKSLAAGTVLVTSTITGCSQVQPVGRVFGGDDSGRLHTRRDAHRLGVNSATMQAFRAGVARMRALPLNDCRSWLYQANIHGTTLPRSEWPPNAPFSECQHGNIHFFPWHRMYLYFFERIVRSLSGNANFAVPYWNYGRANQRNLPPAFRAAGSPLFDNTRNASVNNGASLPPSGVSSTLAMARTNFSGSGQFSAALEGTPHGTVHTLVGGNMARFPTAGRDPVFWSHHSNIDRLWEVWLRRGGGRSSPTGNANWMNAVSVFPNERCELISIRNSDMVNMVQRLGYQYDDNNSAQLASEPAYAGMFPFFRAQASGASGDEEISAETGVATAAPAVSKADVTIDEVELARDQLATGIDLSATNAAEQVVIPVSTAVEESVPSLAIQDIGVAAIADEVLVAEESVVVEAVAPRGDNIRVIIEFRDISEAEAFDGYFEVYLVNRGAGVATGSGRYVGNLPLFGTDRASMQTVGMGHHMRDLDLDITEYFHASELGEGFSTEGVAVMLQPVRVGEVTSDALETARPRVGSMDIKTVELPRQ